MKTIAIACVGLMAACSAAVPKTREPGTDERRQQMLAWLEEYEEAGVYPTDEQGWPQSVFRDANGVRCPMAELIYRSGRADLVDWVATHDNHLRLADVHDGPLADWMATSGLTRDEIVMVQGAMDIDYPSINVENLQFVNAPTPNVVTAEAHGRVRGRIEGALTALKPVDQRAVARKPAPRRVAESPRPAPRPSK